MTSLLLLAVVRPAVTLPPLFSDHMVLQRDRQVRVWGWGAPGTPVEAKLGSWTGKTTVGDSGDWQLWIPAQKAGGPHTLRVNDEVFVDVLFGDVWVCSGQSNMQWSVAQSANPEQEIANASHPKIRLYQVPMTASEHPLAAIGSGWAVCSPTTVRDFSAVGYYFGRELLTKTDVPVGLINTSWGGTPVESWTSRPALMQVPESKQWLEQHLATVKAGTVNQNRGWHPGALYNAMVAPLTKFPIRGAIWYQGESNADKPELYSRTFPNMIRDWRRAWGQGDFPFYFVQLASFNTNADWPRLREAQSQTLRILPSTGMATAIDIGTSNDIHPRNKQDVGRRLALWALRDVHKQPVDPSGPTFLALLRTSQGLTAAFEHNTGLRTTDGGPVKGFQVAGSDKVFSDATARIDRDTVVLSSNSVTDIKYVRYAWSSDPKVNLVNGAGLPALPFRTDTD